MLAETTHPFIAYVKNHVVIVCKDNIYPCVRGRSLMCGTMPDQLKRQLLSETPNGISVIRPRHVSVEIFDDDLMTENVAEITK